ncbi:MAG: ASCH domain-containing protein [Planctomycetota bacterium]
MKALTLWRPWPWAIFYPQSFAAKDVENRTWPPPKSIIGQQIAIHAGKRYDDDSAFDIAWEFGIDNLPTEAKHEGIIGLVVIDRGISGGRQGCGPANLPNDQAIYSDWYHGPHGWVMRDRILLPRPVPCRGAQGLWTVPQTVLDQIRDQLAHLDECREELL